MKTKHKLTQDFQLLSDDKKIYVLKKGTILEEYLYKLKDISLKIDKDIIDNNPLYFDLIDWKTELLLYVKSSKLPTPAVLTKKLIPFIEDMILSSIQQVSTPLSDDRNLELEQKESDLNRRDIKVNDRNLELEQKESGLNRRDLKINDKEEEIEIRLKRIIKREEDYKEDIKLLDNKENDLRERFKEFTEQEFNLSCLSQDLNERERNLDKQILEYATNLDVKYSDMQLKISEDIILVTEKENILEAKLNSLKDLEVTISKRESDINDKERDISIREEDINFTELELKKIKNEISDWESLHWKFKANKPPSCL
jgi:uncharacterized protein (DUF3084 family)